MHAKHLKYELSRSVDLTNTFLENYSQQRTDIGQRLRLEDSIAILALQQKFAFLINGYCKFNFSRNPLDTSPRLYSQVNLENIENPQLSAPELRRHSRAFWRWQLYSTLFIEQQLIEGQPLFFDDFDPWWEAPNADAFVWVRDTISDGQVANKFISLFPIHEIEELACLYSYTNYIYEEWDHDDFAVSLGPEFLYRILNAPRKETPRRPFVYDGLDLGRSLRDALHQCERAVDRGTWHWVGEDDHRGKDRVSTDGWRWASSRGEPNTDLRLRRWGYVFWDRERLDAWDITKEKMLDFPWLKRT